MMMVLVVWVIVLKMHLIYRLYSDDYTGADHITLVMMQGYFQAIFYYQYTAVNTQSLIEF